VLTHPMLDQLTQLGLSGMTQAFAELEASGEGASLTHADWLGLLVDREVTHRRDKRLAARLRYARLRHHAVVEDVDYRTPRGLDRAVFHKLTDGQWIDAHDNLILCGPTGVGKSWLSCALGNKACRDNRSVLYQRVPKLFADLALARGDGRHARIMRSLTGAQLLILDDWGLDPLDGGARRDLYEILEERYGRRSTILTSQIRSPSTNGIRSSASRPTPTPSSIASSTMPIASICPATAYVGPDHDQPQRIDHRHDTRQKPAVSRTP
jgi:DNA replication protein DnaC